MQKILIAYASAYGSTAEVAHEMGKLLTNSDVTVKVCRLPDVDCLEEFDAVIVGSAIQYDRWMPDARKFVINNAEALAKIPVAFFFNCLTLARRTDETEKKANQYANQIFALDMLVKPLSIGRFAGVLNYTKMPFFLKLIFKIFGSIVGLQAGDYRNWNEIRLWTKEIEAQFKNAIVNTTRR